jgi:hypothetical protein
MPRKEKGSERTLRSGLFDYTQDMPLSATEKAFMTAVYERQRRRKYQQAGIIFGALIPASTSMVRLIRDPHASHYTVAIFSGLLGLILGIAVVASLVASSQHKHDEKLIHFFEQHFPDDCSWKQEEKILAEVEELRLKAKAHSLLHKAAH